MATKISVERQITEAVEAYANFHGVEVGEVDVTREVEGDRTTRFRLSLDTDGRSRGCDEWVEATH